MPSDQDKRRGHQVAFPSVPSKAAAPEWYPDFLEAVSARVHAGRQRAVMAANQELVTTYRAVGNEIVGRMDAAGWGARVVDRLTADLREWFPDAKGFSPPEWKTAITKSLPAELESSLPNLEELEAELAGEGGEPT